MSSSTSNTGRRPSSTSATPSAGGNNVATRFAIPFATGVVMVIMLSFYGDQLVHNSKASQIEAILDVPRELYSKSNVEEATQPDEPQSLEELRLAVEEAQQKYEAAKRAADEVIERENEKERVEEEIFDGNRIEQEIKKIKANQYYYTNEHLNKAQEARNKRKHEIQNEGSKDKKPMNIVVFYADDWRHDSIGIAGTQIVQTPFLDQLAKEGIRFTHNCVTTSVCWISRATYYSGQYMRRHKTTMPDNAIWYKDWKQSWPTLLKEAGYYQGHVGKWHFDGGPVQDTWDFWRSYYGCHWCGKRHITKMNELDSMDFLKRRPRDKPFLLSACFFAPHSHDGNPEVYLPQNESMKLYQDVEVPVPESFTEEAWQKLPGFFQTGRNEGRHRFHQRFDEPAKFQKMMKNYYRLISEVDYACGKVIEELEKQGVLDNTLIIFTTDNGYYHAEHGLAGKWYPHQESIRVPLIIKDPRMPKEKVGTTNDEFTLSIDLASTILGAAGVDPGDRMQGRDIADLYLKNPVDGSKWREQFFYEHPVHLEKDIIPASEALVRKDYKYMYWPDYDVEQFFDLKEDPLELEDLIKSEEHQPLIDLMREEYRKRQKEAE